MTRFFMAPSAIGNQPNQIVLEGEDAKHVGVLRLQRGDMVVVCDGCGNDYLCQLVGYHPKDKVVTLAVLEQKPSTGELDIQITLFQGLPKSDKMELIIQKCVELGVFAIVPVETAHAIAKSKPNQANKMNRLQKIAQAAAEQSGRGIVPQIHEPVSFATAVDMAKKMDHCFVAYEQEKHNTLGHCFAQTTGKHIGLFIGPEGGFAPQEIEQCLGADMVTVTLGNRILRTETAGFVGIVILSFLRGGA